MAALKEIRQRIKAVRGIQQVTKAMKMVAAVKMRRAETRLIKARAYAGALEEIAVGFKDRAGERRGNRSDCRDAVVVMGSDGGLCGGFNVTLFRHILATFERRNTLFFSIGRKARIFCERQSLEIAGSYEKLDFPVPWNDVKRMVSEISARYSSVPLRSVKLAYQKFVSPGISRIAVEQWLPFGSGAESEGDGGASPEFRFEPGRLEIRSEIESRIQVARFGKALLESQASEQGARMTAMDNATSNAGELQQSLGKLANSIRQWNITRELLEITTGVEARKN